MALFGKTIQTLEHHLDYSQLKHKTIVNNIANVDTPNYKAKEVVFKDMLSSEMNSTIQAKRTNPKHINFSQHHSVISPFHITTSQSSTYNHNGNNVDIDKEMTSLAENQIYYQALIDRINGKFTSLKTVIKGGR